MKLITIIILAVAAILIPFRHRITKETMTRLACNPATIMRLIYIGFAILWVFVADDAARIHVPHTFYVAVPSGVLLLYAIFPLKTIWVLVPTTLITGWSLHMYQSMRFQIVHLGIKTDMYGLIFFGALYLLMLLGSLAILYATGPFMMKICISKKESHS
jgi:hypothetical protein